MYLNMTKTNNIARPDKYIFRIYSYNASTGATSTNYENYQLPAVTAGLSSSPSYNILTSKDYSFINTQLGINTSSGSTTEWLTRKGDWTTPTAA